MRSCVKVHRNLFIVSYNMICDCTQLRVSHYTICASGLDFLKSPLREHVSINATRQGYKLNFMPTWHIIIIRWERGALFDANGTTLCICLQKISGLNFVLLRASSYATFQPTAFTKQFMSVCNSPIDLTKNKNVVQGKLKEEKNRNIGYHNILKWTKNLFVALKRVAHF